MQLGFFGGEGGGQGDEGVAIIPVFGRGVGDELEDGEALQQGDEVGENGEVVGGEFVEGRRCLHEGRAVACRQGSEQAGDVGRVDDAEHVGDFRAA